MVIIEMSKGTSTTRARKKDILLWRTEIPEYDSAEVFKVGVTTLTSIKKAGRFVYGKNMWDKQYVKSKKTKK